MATDLPRFTITLPDDLYALVLQYKAEQNITTQSKAIQKLIEIGIETVAQDGSGASLRRKFSETENRLVSSWRQSDERAKEDVAHALRDFGFSYEVKKKKEA